MDTEKDIVINPDNCCKTCLRKGKVKFWNSNKGTYRKTDFKNLRDEPCNCLIKNYHVLNNKTSPIFELNKGILQIVLKSDVKTEKV